MTGKGLDEMQVQRKNKIGNQAFLMLFYLLLIDIGLQGFGFQWLEYPENVMVILMTCSGIYVVRLILANAFVGPAPEKQNPFLRVLITVILSLAVAAIILLLMKNARFSDLAEVERRTAPIMLGTAGVAVVISVTTIVVNRIQNRKDE